MQKVNLEQALGQIGEHWRPHIVADFNDSKVQVAKFEGDFVWHKHDDTDDFFLVLDGRMLLDLPGETVVLEPGGCSWSRAACSTARAPRAARCTC
jgi:mannose-6-phosphate isomerase-like protein (cupin superfamily)